MAQYPINLPQVIGTSFNEESGAVVSRSINGRPRIRNNFSQIWRTGEIIHDLSQSELDSLMTFYNANKAVAFTFIYQADNVTYSCQFASSPISRPILGGRYDVKVLIIEVV